MSAEDPTFAEQMTARDGIRSVTVDGTTVTADSVSDAIAIDEYNRKLAAQTGNLQGHRGLLFGIFVPPGGGGY